MPKPTPFDGLLADICNNSGYCGGPGHVTDFIPPRGRVTKSDFADWVFLAEGMDPKVAESEHRKIFEAKFVKHLGSGQTDVSRLVAMGMQRRLVEAPAPAKMIQVLSPPAVKFEAGRCELVFWLGEPGHASIPFRDVLVQIVAVLGEDTSLKLDEEDVCVQGELVWQGRKIDVYYEYMLGYLMLSADHWLVLDEVVERLRPIVSVTQDG